MHGLRFVRDDAEAAPALPKPRDADTAAVIPRKECQLPSFLPVPSGDGSSARVELTFALHLPAALNQKLLPELFFPLLLFVELEAPPQAHPSTRRRVAIDLDECAELWAFAGNFLHQYAFETLTKRITPHPRFFPPIPYLSGVHYAIRRELISSSWLRSLFYDFAG